MIKYSINWLYILEEKLHPSALVGVAEQQSGFTQLFNDFKISIKQFRFYFANLVGRSRPEAQAILMQLTVVSDTIHHYMIGMAGAWREHPLSDQVRQLYIQTLTRLETLLESCGRFDNISFSNLPLTAYSIQAVRMQLRKRLSELGTIVIQSDINPVLGELVLGGLKRLIERQEMNRSDATYASMILDELEKLEPFATVEVKNLLYQYDFNTPAFFNYCTKCCNQLLIETPCLHTQLEMLIGWEDRINGLPARSILKWMTADMSIRDQLRDFFKEKKLYVQQRIEIRKAVIHDGKLTNDMDRMQVNLPVAQFGLFIRLFMEKGLLPKEEVGKTFAYYARHFSTPKTPFISAESLQKKSTDVEFSTAKKIKGHLIGMVNWLNEHYNVSNYRDS